MTTERQHDLPSQENRGSKLTSILLLAGSAIVLGLAAWIGLDVPKRIERVRVERRLMATLWAIEIETADAEAARRASERALDEVDRIERLLSEWMPESEISKVNRAAGDRPVRVGPELMTCVQASQRVSDWSDGAFDITWAGLRDLWDFSAESAHMPPGEQEVRAKLPLWNFRFIVIDERNRTIFLKHAGMAIGLGGVAKGYALDRVGEILKQEGFDNFLIFGGGQLLAHGHPKGRAWRVGIQHPRRNAPLASLEVENASVSTSGDYEHSWEHEGVRYHHILDPRTGFPSRASTAVTVLSPTALWADAIDTALFVMGPELAMQKIRSAPGGPHQALLIDGDQRVSMTEGARRRISMRFSLGADRTIGAPLPDVPALSDDVPNSP